MDALILAVVAREALPAPKPVPVIEIRCGDAAILLSGLPPDLQVYVLLAVQKVIARPEFLAIIAKKWPDQVDNADRLLAVCGAG
jgi:hypothetical protein